MYAPRCSLGPLRYFFKVAIYAAMSSAAARLNGKSGIFGCGFNRKYANSLGLKFGDLAIVAKGGRRRWHAVDRRKQHGKERTIVWLERDHAEGRRNSSVALKGAAQ
jgi:hypothetical protein